MKQSINIFNYKTGIDYLKDVYQSSSEQNPRYSLRSFALKLDLDQSTLTRYLSKERTLSPRNASIISINLKHTEAESQYFRLLTSLGDIGDFNLLEKLSTSFLHEKYRQLTESTTTVKSFDENDTVNFRLFLVHMIKCFQPSMESRDIAEFLSKFIHLEESEVTSMLDYLKKIGRIAEEGGPIIDNNIKFHITLDEVRRKDWKNLNLDILEIFRNGMQNADVTDIEMHGSLLPVVKGSREKIHSLVKQINALMTDSCYAEDDNPDDELYLLGSCMINLTPPNFRKK
jgi:uncharacterized protein (TIGR02147 family)